jgi:hypothetical protein
MPGGKQESAAKKEKALESTYITVQERLFLVPMAGVEPAWRLSNGF